MLRAGERVETLAAREDANRLGSAVAVRTWLPLDGVLIGRLLMMLRLQS